MNRFFQIISWVFMPLTTPLIGLVIVLYTPTHLDFNTVTNSLYYIDASIKQFFFNAFALFGWILPIMSILVLKVSKQIDTVELDNQQQRFIPLMLSGIYAIMLTILLVKFNNQLKLSSHLFGLSISGAFIGISSAIINMNYKISLHATGVGMLIGFLFCYYLEHSLIIAWPVYLACILGGLVVTSRMWLKKHTNNELIIGCIFGFISTFIVDLLSIYFF